ncbi:MAG: efflux RND transporter periplasmic adaptor subunit, partial [Verrucomicrobia bacterium]|nr:efflux RND transporter periplasmic adaptor subunit [Verrucomicrobiota bacterium]
MKKLIIVLIIAALAGGGWYYYKQSSQKAAPTVQNRQDRGVQKVKRRSIQLSITAAGDISPAEQVSVIPETSGRIKALLVDIGDNVKKGDVLVTLDDETLLKERDTQTTEIEGSRLQVERDKRSFNRAQQLFDKGLLSTAEYESALATYQISTNNLVRSEKSLAQIDERLSKTQILAPFDCTVLTRPVSVGQAVSGSDGASGGTECLTVADLNQMIIDAHINQADVTRMKLGQEVNIQVEAVTGLKLTGVVERIAPQATLKNNIKGFSCRILLKNPDERVRPGMTANISIPIALADNVLTVPLSAVFTEGGERFVYIKNGDTWEQRNVKIGVADFSFVEIQDGLNEDEIVALEPPSMELVAESTSAQKSKMQMPGAPGAGAGGGNR